MYVQRNNERRWRKHCSRGKVISITYSECVFIALLIRHAKRMRVSYCHVWSLRLYNIFTHYFETFPTLRRIERVRIKKYTLVFVSDFNET